MRSAPNKQLNAGYVIQILSVQTKMQILSLSIFSYHRKSKIVQHFMPGIELNARQKNNKNVDPPILIFQFPD